MRHLFGAAGWIFRRTETGRWRALMANIAGVWNGSLRAGRLPRRAVAVELALYAGAYLLYLLSRGLVYADLRAAGLANGERVAAWQQSLGLLWEPAWQAWAIEHIPAVVALLNWVYIVTYWPVILLLAALLFLYRRRDYYYYRTVIFISLAGALLTFMLFPVASPFAIATVELTDTIQAYGPAFYGGPAMAELYNTTAAMPSLHFAWTVILGVYLWRTLPGLWRIAGAVYPALTFATIVLTGNHFILDAAAGGALAAAAFALTALLYRRRAG